MPAWLAPTLIGAGIGFIQSKSAQSSANKAKNEENAFYKQKLDEYDMPAWQMSADKLIADRDFIIEGINLKASNERKFANFQDQNNLRAYQQQLKIRNYQHEQQKRLYQKSEHLYGQSLQQAQEQAALQMKETKQQFAFQNEDRIIESIQKKGELAATSQTGRSAVKAAQSEMYDQGRQIAIMTESLISADKNTRMGLRDFMRKADAQRMLRPEIGPEPLKPLKTPLHDYQLPRALEDFDFGPAPVLGATASVSAAGSAAFWGSAASGIGKGLAGLAGNINLGGGASATPTSYEVPLGSSIYTA